jgi:hypothetical protein
VRVHVRRRELLGHLGVHVRGRRRRRRGPAEPVGQRLLRLRVALHLGVDQGDRVAEPDEDPVEGAHVHALRRALLLDALAQRLEQPAARRGREVRGRGVRDLAQERGEVLLGIAVGPCRPPPVLAELVSSAHGRRHPSPLIAVSCYICPR